MDVIENNEQMKRSRRKAGGTIFSSRKEWIH